MAPDIARLAGFSPIRAFRTHQGAALCLAIGVSHVATLAIYAILSRGHGGFFQAVCTWDCGWYASIAGYGYDSHAIAGPANAGQANWVFFPAYPLLARMVSALTDPNPARGLVLLNMVLLPVMVGMSVTYGMRRGLITAPILACVVMFVFPYSIYFRSGYSEPLYGVLLIGSLLLLDDRKHVQAGLSMALLTLTRPTGVLVAATAALLGLLPTRWSGNSHNRHAVCRNPAFATRLFVALKLVAPSCAALALFMVFMHEVAGDALAFVHVQRAFGRRIGNPVAHLYSGLVHPDLGNLASLTGRSEFLLTAVAMLAGSLTVWLALRRRLLEAAILGSTLLVAAATGLDSVPRYIFANPLALLAVSASLEGCSRGVRSALLCGMFGLQLVFVMLWYRRAVFLI